MSWQFLRICSVSSLAWANLDVVSLSLSLVSCKEATFKELSICKNKYIYEIIYSLIISEKGENHFKEKLLKSHNDSLL